MRDFRELRVWTKAHELTLATYRATTNFPGHEMYGLTSQMANIAEGNGRGTDSEMARFLHIALGSGSELEYYFILARDLTYLGSQDHEDLTTQVTDAKRMLTGFIQTLKEPA